MKRKIAGLIVIACLLCVTTYGVLNKAAMRKHALLFPRDGYYMLDSAGYSADSRYNPPLGGPLAALNMHPEFESAQRSYGQPFINLGGGSGVQYRALVLWFVQVEPLPASVQTNESSADVWENNLQPSLWVQIKDEQGYHTEAMASLGFPDNETGYAQVRPLSIQSFPRRGKRLTATLYGRNPETNQPVLLGSVPFKNPDVQSKPDAIPQKLPATVVDSGWASTELLLTQQPLTTANADNLRVQLTSCRYLTQQELERLPYEFKNVVESLRLPATKSAPPGITAHFQVVGAQPGQWTLHSFSVADGCGNRSDALGADASFCRGMDGYAAAPLSRPLKTCEVQAEFFRNDPAIKVVTINIDPKIALRAQSVVKTIPMPYTGADGKPRVIKTILSLTVGSDGNLHAEYGADSWTPHIYPALEVVDPSQGGGGWRKAPAQIPRVRLCWASQTRPQAEKRYRLS